MLFILSVFIEHQNDDKHSSFVSSPLESVGCLFVIV